MSPAFRIERLTQLHPGMEPLRAEAAAEGFGFMDRLIKEWRSGVNRFDQPGEVLLGALNETSLVAICGLNRDPYTEQEGIGRLRHLYVRRSDRRHGVASCLVDAILEAASNAFGSVRLRTDTRDAALFYAAHDFMPVESETASHVKQLRPPQRATSQ